MITHDNELAPPIADHGTLPLGEILAFCDVHDYGRQMDRNDPAKPHLSFLGLGLMGSPIATRLAQAGMNLHVWNRNRAKTSSAVAAGAIAHASARQAAQGADIVFLCVTDHHAVEAILFSDDGVAPVLKPGTLLVDLSTIGPAPTREMAQRLWQEHGVHWLDCPLSGGVAGAKQGTLIALCGGEAEHVAQTTPLLRHFARTITHMGPVGAGQAAKLCNQMIVTINLLAIREALTLAEAHGIDPAMLPAALAGGWADSLPLQIIGPRMATLRDEPKIAAIGTFAKDIAAAITGSSAAELPLAHAAAALYEAALAKGQGDCDIALLDSSPSL